MTGNADRRRQLATQRKLDTKHEIQRRGAGFLKFTHSEVRARLLQECSSSGGRKSSVASTSVNEESSADNSVSTKVEGINVNVEECTTIKQLPHLEEDLLTCWVELDLPASYCSAYLRDGACDNKRCRFKHSLSLAHLKGIPPSNVAESPQLRGQLKQISLRKFIPTDTTTIYDSRIRTQIRPASNLRFIEYNGSLGEVFKGPILIFDWENPSVFSDFMEAYRPVKVTSPKTKPLAKGKEKFTTDLVPDLSLDKEDGPEVVHQQPSPQPVLVNLWQY